MTKKNTTNAKNPFKAKGGKTQEHGKDYVRTATTDGINRKRYSQNSSGSFAIRSSTR